MAGFVFSNPGFSTTTSGTGGTALTVVGVNAGATLLASCAFTSASAVPSVSDNGTNRPWTQVAIAQGNSYTVALFMRQAQTADNSMTTVTFSSGGVSTTTAGGVQLDQLYYNSGGVAPNNTSAPIVDLNATLVLSSAATFGLVTQSAAMRTPGSEVAYTVFGGVANGGSPTGHFSPDGQTTSISFTYFTGSNHLQTGYVTTSTLASNTGSSASWRSSWTTSSVQNLIGITLQWYPVPPPVNLPRQAVARAGSWMRRATGLYTPTRPEPRWRPRLITTAN